MEQKQSGIEHLIHYPENVRDIELPQNTIYEYMCSDNSNHPLGKSLTYIDRTMTFFEFNYLIDRCAKSFLNMGIQKGDYVPIISPNLPQGVISFYALNAIGAISNMIHPLSSEEDFKHYLSETDAKTMVMFNDSYKTLQYVLPKTNIKKIVNISPLTYMSFLARKYVVSNHIIEENSSFFASDSKFIDWNKFLKTSTVFRKLPKVDSKGDDVATLLHTGGTTGTPKTSEITNINFNTMVEQYRAFIDNLERGDRILTVLPIFIGYGLCNNVHMPLSFGINVVLVPDYKPEEAYNLFAKYHPNHFMCVADYFIAMMNDKRFDNMDLSFLKTIVYGGEAMKPEQCRLFNEWLVKHGAKNVIIRNGYGMTESTSSIAYENKLKDTNEYGLIGLPFTDIKIIREGTIDEEADYGEVGEICSCGPTTMKGYLNDIEGTNEVLKLHSDGKVWLHTADLGKKDQNGKITYTGRIKRMYPTIGPDKVVGKIFSVEIENAILSTGLVKNCAVVGVEHDERVNVPVAFIVLNDNAEYSQDVLDTIKYSCMKLTNYRRPYNFHFCSSLPMTKINKIAYSELEKTRLNDEEIYEESFVKKMRKN